METQISRHKVILVADNTKTTGTIFQCCNEEKQYGEEKKGKILGLRTILKWRSFLLKRSADVKPDVFFINLDNVFSDVNRSLISFLSVNQRCSILNK